MLRKKQLTEEQARLRLADLCARSEQCESDLMRKLRLWGLPASSAANVITDLRKGKFVDDSRFAGAFARDKARFSKWGKNKIRLGLMAKGISSGDIKDGLDSIDEPEYLEALTSVAKAKARTLDLSKHEDVRKLYTTLLSRGYESSLIHPVIKKLKA